MHYSRLMLTGVTQKCWQEHVKRNSRGNLEFMFICWQDQYMGSIFDLYTIHPVFF